MRTTSTLVKLELTSADVPQVLITLTEEVGRRGHAGTAPTETGEALLAQLQAVKGITWRSLECFGVHLHFEPAFDLTETLWTSLVAIRSVVGNVVFGIVDGTDHFTQPVLIVNPTREQFVEQLNNHLEHLEQLKQREKLTPADAVELLQAALTVVRDAGLTPQLRQFAAVATDSGGYDHFGGHD